MENVCERDFLPKDSELLKREKRFFALFDKFDVDEGSDAEIIEHESSNDEMFNDDINDSASEYSDYSSSASEESFDIEKIHQELQPFITNRINAWVHNGTNLKLKTVHPSVTVEEWLKANEEISSTTKKSTKTVIDKEKRRITVMTTETKTTTSRRSYIGTSRNQVTMTEESPKNNRSEKKKKAGKKRTEQMDISDLFSKKSKCFPLPTPRKRNAKKVTLSPKVKVISPRKKLMRKAKRKTVDEEKHDDPQTDDEPNFNNVTLPDIDCSNEESPQAQKQQTEKSTSKIPVVKLRKLSVIQSPVSRRTRNMRKSQQIISLRRQNIIQKINVIYRHCQTLPNESICRTNEKVVYTLPEDKEDGSIDDDEADELLTCFRRRGQFLRLNEN
ncbi:hypothetical protein Bhyg_11123 [Pseudolycoriella hygida]|uniref:Uncharacterized protein n=1 Tax=Pseudolycoriella hygida TaxID=35572 RepID=A0A9Q0RZZ4_9DIPT|nr:hypothetical protein Bhyg_11123 [Pseudolycoriella hygida]